MLQPQDVTQEELNEVEETTDQTAPTDETNESTSKSEEDASQTSESTEETVEEQDVDFAKALQEEEARIERAKKKRTKLEKQIVDKKQELKELDTSTNSNDLDALREEISTLRDQLTSIASSSTQSVISKYSSNEDEAKLIQFYLDNRIKPSGDFEADVRAAKAIANQQSILKQNKELSHALRQKGKSSGFNGSSQKKQAPKEKNYSLEEQKYLRAMGKNV